MKRIILNKGKSLQTSRNTLTEYDAEISIETLGNRLEKLREAISSLDGCAVYVFGMGGHAKSLYQEVSRHPDCELIFCKSVLPALLGFLNIITASYSGLFKLNKFDDLPDIFFSLVEGSMATIYIIPSEFETEFLNKITSATSNEYEFGVKSNKNYLIYMVDADNPESSTGIYEIVSFGVESDFLDSVFLV